MKPWRKQMWCIPPERNAEFVCAMENVLEVYHRRYDPKRPMICMDETGKQLVKETRAPQPPGPGRPERFDYECERNGERVHVLRAVGGPSASRGDGSPNEVRLG